MSVQIVTRGPPNWLGSAPLTSDHSHRNRFATRMKPAKINRVFLIYYRYFTGDGEMGPTILRAPRLCGEQQGGSHAQPFAAMARRVSTRRSIVNIKENKSRTRPSLRGRDAVRVSIWGFRGAGRRHSRRGDPGLHQKWRRGIPRRSLCPAPSRQSALEALQEA
jgi:hypothetical protein